MSKAFETLIAAARQGVQRKRARSLAQPCFDDVLERARGLGRSGAPAATQQRLGVVASRNPDPETAADEAALDAMIDGARAAVQRRVAHRQLDGVPAPARPVRPPLRRAWMVAGALAFATAAGLVGGVAIRATTLVEDQPAGGGEQAARSTPIDHTKGRAESAPLPPPVRRTPRVVDEAELETDEPLEAVVEPVVEPERLLPAERPTNRRAQLNALAERAQAHWREGDLVEARRLFERVVAGGGRTRQVELAYADLFALAHQRGQRQDTLWRAYLKRFPKGQFADDASAGLCRVAAEQARPTCWRSYLEAFPRGAYHTEAQRAIKP